MINQAPTLSKPARLSTSVVITALGFLSEEVNPRKKPGLIANPPSNPPPNLSLDSAFCSVIGCVLEPAWGVSLTGLASCSFSIATSPSCGGGRGGGGAVVIRNNDV